MNTSVKSWLPDFSVGQHLLLAWPYKSDVWRENAVPAREFVDLLVRHVSQYTPVTLLVHPHFKHTVPAELAAYCTLVIEQYDDIWLRDTLPLWCTENDRTLGTQFQFDGWGGVQSVVQSDKTLAFQLSSWLQRPLLSNDLITEGGTFTHNGQGTWLVGLSSIKQRNSHLSNEQIIAQLAQSFPGQTLYYFDGAFIADETGGHIDNMALFVDEKTLLYATTNEPEHPDFATCKRLASLVKSLPADIEKVAVPLPQPQRPNRHERSGVKQLSTSLNRTENLLLLCSYINILVTDKLVIVPEFGLPSDGVALARIREAVSNKVVLSLPARELVLGGGGMHCISHNLTGLSDEQALTT